MGRVSSEGEGRHVHEMPASHSMMDQPITGDSAEPTWHP